MRVNHALRHKERHGEKRHIEHRRDSIEKRNLRSVRSHLTTDCLLIVIIVTAMHDLAIEEQRSLSCFSLLRVHLQLIKSKDNMRDGRSVPRVFPIDVCKSSSALRTAKREGRMTMLD